MTGSFTPLNLWFIVYFICFMIFVTAFVTIIVLLSAKRNKPVIDDELRLAKEIIESGINYYKNIDRMLQEIRILRHDYKYQIGVIEELAKISNAKYINEFLESTRTRFIQSEPVVYCENMIVSALLANYSERFAVNKIPFKFQAALPACINHTEGRDPLNNYEICMLLGNILENALEGTMTVIPQERRVSLTMRMADNQLMIEAQNTFDGKLIFPRDTLGMIKLPVTRKGADGGYGHKSIMAVCKRHMGEYLPQWTENEYTVRILLNI